jgi:hypothetical protein
LRRTLRPRMTTRSTATASLRSVSSCSRQVNLRHTSHASQRLPCFFHDPANPGNDGIRAVSARINQAVEKLSRVSEVANRQLVFAILREARNVGLVNHLLRHIHPALWDSQSPNILTPFDTTAVAIFVRNALGDLHGDDTELHGSDMQALAAPPSSSGAGIRRASDVAAAAWLSCTQQSFARVLPLATVITGDEVITRALIERLAIPARDAFHVVTGVARNPTEDAYAPDFRTYAPPNPDVDVDEYKDLMRLQPSMCAQIDKRHALGRSEDIVHNGVPVDFLKRQIEAMRPTFLFAIAGRNGGISYTDDETSAIFQMHLGLHLRFAFRGAPVMRQCTRHTIHNHSLGSCNRIITHRHEEICAAIARAATKARCHGRVDANLSHQWPVINVDAERYPNFGATLFPGDITVTNFNGSQTDHFFDVSVVDIMANAHIHAKIEDCLFARHRQKMIKYSKSCRQIGVPFAPLVLTHLGLFHATSRVHLSTLLGIEKPREGQPMSAEQRRRKLIKRDLLNEVACIAAKYNARSLLNHAPLPGRPHTATTPPPIRS